MIGCIACLPAANAAMNATSAVLLVAGVLFIKHKRVSAHRVCMVSAFIVSILFLVSYLYYHINYGSTRFSGTGWIRWAYFAILGSHTILAAAVPFLAVVTLFRAWREQFDRHRRIARWTFPIWLYVSVTGVAVYVMLYHLYPPD